MSRKVAILVGSLRKGSIARKITLNAIEMFPVGFEIQIVEIRGLPLYDSDYDDPAVEDKPLPAVYTEFRETIKSCDAVLFVTPENNRYIPACLKNAVDIGPKPNADVVRKNLPAGIVSHSVGKMGGYSAQKNLRLALSYFDMTLPGQPKVFLGQSPTLLDGAGKSNNEKTRDFVQGYINRLVALAERDCCQDTGAP